VGHAALQNLTFPGVRGRFEALQLAQYLQQSAITHKLRSRRHMLPAQQPAHELCLRYRLNLAAQFTDGEPVDTRQQTAFAPLEPVLARAVFMRTRLGGSSELATQNRSAGFQLQKCFIDLLWRNTEQIA